MNVRQRVSTRNVVFVICTIVWLLGALVSTAAISPTAHAASHSVQQKQDDCINVNADGTCADNTGGTDGTSCMNVNADGTCADNTGGTDGTSCMNVNVDGTCADNTGGTGGTQCTNINADGTCADNTGGTGGTQCTNINADGTCADNTNGTGGTPTDPNAGSNTGNLLTYSCPDGTTYQLTSDQAASAGISTNDDACNFFTVQDQGYLVADNGAVGLCGTGKSGYAVPPNPPDNYTLYKYEDGCTVQGAITTYRAIAAKLGYCTTVGGFAAAGLGLIFVYDPEPITKVGAGVGSAISIAANGSCGYAQTRANDIAAQLTNEDAKCVFPKGSAQEGQHMGIYYDVKQDEDGTYSIEGLDTLACQPYPNNLQLSDSPPTQ